MRLTISWCRRVSLGRSWLGCSRCGVVWCGVVWCGVVWCGVVWCGVVWCGVVWCGVVWCGVVWCGVVPFAVPNDVRSCPCIHRQGLYYVDPRIVPKVRVFSINGSRAVYNAGPGANETPEFAAIQSLAEQDFVEYPIIFAALGAYNRAVWRAAQAVTTIQRMNVFLITDGFCRLPGVATTPVHLLAPKGDNKKSEKAKLVKNVWLAVQGTLYTCLPLPSSPHPSLYLVATQTHRPLIFCRCGQTTATNFPPKLEQLRTSGMVQSLTLYAPGLYGTLKLIDEPNDVHSFQLTLVLYMTK